MLKSNLTRESVDAYEMSTNDRLKLANKRMRKAKMKPCCKPKKPKK